MMRQSALLLGLSCTFLAIPEAQARRKGCSDLQHASAPEQVTIVVDKPACAANFIEGLESDPARYLEAFYLLIRSPATDALFGVVYDEIRHGRFRFKRAVVDELLRALPNAVAACKGSFRCEDWARWMLTPLYEGGMFACPTASEMNPSELAQSVPYGDFACTESIARALAPRAESETISSLLAIAQEHPGYWGRRNALRVLGRLAERPATDKAHQLVRVDRAPDVLAALRGVLQQEKESVVLSDAIWVLYTFFGGRLSDMREQLQAISLNRAFDEQVRWRAADAAVRLIVDTRSPLSALELAYLSAALRADEKWVAATAAWGILILEDGQLTPEQRNQIREQLAEAWQTSSELIVQTYLARALDRFDYGGAPVLFNSLKESYERSLLPNELAADGVVIRSGLQAPDLSALLRRLGHESSAFFEIMGSPFDSPLSGYAHPTITLHVFATRAAYQTYMDGFIGFGANAGGLYLHDTASLYTYARTPAESRYTLNELVQHEFGHALQHKYIFPGSWGEPGYFDQPTGWAAEGQADFLGGLEFDETGRYSLPPRRSHLEELCAPRAPRRELASLLAQREGYDEYGVFDYVNAWALNYFLFTERRDPALRVFAAFRERAYQPAKFPELLGLPALEEAEHEWHASIDRWCEAAPPAATLASARVAASPAPAAPGMDQATDVLHIRGIGGPPPLVSPKTFRQRGR